MEKKKFDLIEDYIDQNLSPLELEDFEKQLLSDPEFKKRFEAHKAARVVMGMIEKEALRKKLKGLSKSRGGIFSSEKTKVVAMRTRIIQSIRYAAAAAVLIFMTVLAFLYIESPNYSSSIFAELNNREYTAIERSGAQAETRVFIEIKEKYHSGDWSGTIEQIDQLPGNLQELPAELWLIRADAAYRSGYTDHAVSIYESVAALDETDEWNREQAEWKTLLIQLEADPFDPILTGKLKQIAGQEKHLHRQSAQLALDRMAKLRYRIGKLFYTRK